MKQKQKRKEMEMVSHTQKRVKIEAEEADERYNPSSMLRACEVERGGGNVGENGEICGSIDDDNMLKVSLKIPTNLLDCASCLKPLQPPLFQCLGGDHTVCSECCNEDKIECPLCNRFISIFHCFALESIISSIKVTCANARFGCNEIVPYLRKHIHEVSCPSAPCPCPIQDCIFQGSIVQLVAHICLQHRSAKRVFFFGNANSMKIYLPREDPFSVLVGDWEEDRMFLLLNGRDIPSGNSLSMVCIRPVTANWGIQYELSVESGEETSLHLKATPPSMREWKGIYPKKHFLFVPNELSEDPGAIDLAVRITSTKLQ